MSEQLSPIDTQAEETPQPETSISEDMRAKILHLLETFPYISRAMIQTGLSPAMPPKLWDPELRGLVSEGQILVEEITVQNPDGRTLAKQVYHLPKFPYPPVSMNDDPRLEA